MSARVGGEGSRAGGGGRAQRQVRERGAAVPWAAAQRTPPASSDSGRAQLSRGLGRQVGHLGGDGLRAPPHPQVRRRPGRARRGRGRVGRSPARPARARRRTRGPASPPAIRRPPRAGGWRRRNSPCPRASPADGPLPQQRQRVGQRHAGPQGRHPVDRQRPIVRSFGTRARRAGPAAARGAGRISHMAPLAAHAATSPRGRSAVPRADELAGAVTWAMIAAGWPWTNSPWTTWSAPCADPEGARGAESMPGVGGGGRRLEPGHRLTTAHAAPAVGGGDGRPRGRPTRCPQRLTIVDVMIGPGGRGSTPWWRRSWSLRRWRRRRWRCCSGSERGALDAGASQLESAVYGTLQAGPEFAAWRASRPVTRPPGGGAGGGGGARRRPPRARPQPPRRAQRSTRACVTSWWPFSPSPPVIPSWRTWCCAAWAPTSARAGISTSSGPVPDLGDGPPRAHAAERGPAHGGRRRPGRRHLQGGLRRLGHRAAGVRGPGGGPARHGRRSSRGVPGTHPRGGWDGQPARRIGRHRTAALALTGRTIDAATAGVGSGRRDRRTPYTWISIPVPIGARRKPDVGEAEGGHAGAPPDPAGVAWFTAHDRA